MAPPYCKWPLVHAHGVWPNSLQNVRQHSCQFNTMILIQKVKMEVAKLNDFCSDRRKKDILHLLHLALEIHTRCNGETKKAKNCAELTTIRLILVGSEIFVCPFLPQCVGHTHYSSSDITLLDYKLSAVSFVLT